ncbi:hypothetical protein Aph01nite_77390 [Acrocarpospora phusangensis]|uniref:Uncharacterized protein n=1 Tax=Acrocarpospora phusangensis TaxID=1070424 RepID=A0A919QI08_9ACTN|nr:hypothetical protein [Acrocarpospora phusangensis]GIH29429.1 hypothetical protein Aph01nite_77390 [Acrocarpospora phusangensis]
MTEFIAYEQIRKKIATHPLRQSEIPAEHYVSAPLPTLRWTTPAYAVFAAPAARAPGRPLRLSPPDRWWAMSARRRQVLVYAHQSVTPYGQIPTEAVTVTPTGRTFAQAKEDLRLFDELIGEAAPHFFRGETGPEPIRADVGEILHAVLPREGLPWFRALTPDFFDWLER